jgi:hypothetical protein
VLKLNYWKLKLNWIIRSCIQVYMLYPTWKTAHSCTLYRQKMISFSRCSMYLSITLYEESSQYLEEEEVLRFLLLFNGNIIFYKKSHIYHFKIDVSRTNWDSLVKNTGIQQSPRCPLDKSCICFIVGITPTTK